MIVKEKQTLTYWLVQVNTGTSSQADSIEGIQAQQPAGLGLIRPSELLSAFIKYHR